MRRLLSGSSWLSRLLASTSVLLYALAIYPWLMPISAPNASAGMDSEPRIAAAVDALPPLASFSAVFRRPLFSPSRRPPSAVQIVSGGSGVIGHYQLLGVIRVNGIWRALIADANRRVEVLEGSTLDDGTVSQIGQDQVVVSTPRGQTVLKLSRAGGAPASQPSTVPH